MPLKMRTRRAVYVGGTGFQPAWRQLTSGRRGRRRRLAGAGGDRGRGDRRMRTGVRVRAMAGSLMAATAALAAAPAHALTPPAQIAGVATHPWRLEAHSVVPLVALENPFSRERTFSTMERAGISYARVDLRWKDVEAQGQLIRDWSDFDVLVSTARRHHVRVLPVVAYTPAWASGDGHSFSFPRRDSYFQSFMTAASRRSPQVGAGEI